MATGIVDNILTAIRDRARNPLIGSFVVCWLIVNYKTLLVIFGDGKYAEKIDYISNSIYPNLSKGLCLNLVYPLAGSVVYLLITIWPASWYYHWWYFAQKRISERKQKLDGAVLLTKKESIDLHTKYRNLENEHLKLKDDEEQRRGELLNRINTLEAEKDKLKVLLKLPHAYHETTNITTDKVSGHLDGVIKPSLRSDCWRIEFTKKDPNRYGFEVVLKFELRNAIRFDSVFIDLEKFEPKGMIELRNNIKSIVLYQGEDEQTSHLKRWFDLDQKSISDKFSITIRGDAKEGWYQINSIKFREKGNTQQPSKA